MKDNFLSRKLTYPYMFRIIFISYVRRTAPHKFPITCCLLVIFSSSACQIALSNVCFVKSLNGRHVQSCFCNLIRKSTKRYGFETHPFPVGFILGNSKPFPVISYNNFLLFILNELHIIKINFAFMHSIAVYCYVSFDIIIPPFCCRKYATAVY